METLFDLGEKLESSQDQFYNGKFLAIQPIGCGHRSGSDALLIAAGLPQNASGVVADLGSGAGVAGLAAVASNDGLKAILVENNPVMLDFSRKTMDLPENAAYSDRVEIIDGDVTLTGTARLQAGIENNIADYVIMNPPYNHEAQRASPDSLKADAHVMGASGLDPWLRTAVAMLKPGGQLVMIYRTEKLGEVIACATGRFGDISIVPVYSMQNQPAKRLIFKMTKGSRAPLKIVSGIVMHDEEGGPTDFAKALLNGDARIEFA